MPFVVKLTMFAAMAAAVAAPLPAQTVEDLVNKNTEAHGGLAKIQQIKSLRMTGRLQQGTFTAALTRDSMAPNLLRENVTIMGMTLIQAYDGTIGWQISPFQGRKDPEQLGEEETRAIVEEADFYGPLVDYQGKGNTIEYLGHDTVDGDDAYRLKVTLANGDIYYYFLDPETSLEIRTERQLKTHGAVRELFSEMGSYKLVDGVYYPFSIDSGSMRNPNERVKISIDKIEANVTMDPSEFKMPHVEKPK
jgi:hypothetical protein